MLAGNTAYLGPITATGGTTGTAGIYKYHFFTSNGTLAVTVGGAIEICGVGGGGGGGANIGGGGAGGELDIWTALTATANNYDVVVGVGGAGQYSTPTGSNGGTSTFALGATTYVSSLGGGKGGATGNNGNNGGSGGGGGSNGGNAGTASGSNTFAGSLSFSI